MPRLVVVTNFNAGRNRSRPGAIRGLTKGLDAVCLEADDLPSIREATREALRRGPEVLAVNGGDGTVHGALTELMRLDCDLPELAVIPGGTTNMTANDLNDNAALEDTLHRLGEEASASRQDRHTVERPMLRASADGLDAQYGFFLGAGAILDGMAHFRDKVGSKGLRGELAAGISVLRGLAGLVRGDGAWTRDHDIRLRIREEEVLEGQVLVIATTLERMLLGMRPWWGAGAGPIHLTALRRRPRAVFRRAPVFLRGRAHPSFTVENGYFSEDVVQFELRPDSGFALDGEIFDCGRRASVRVDATDPVRFLRLDGR